MAAKAGFYLEKNNLFANIVVMKKEIFFRIIIIAILLGVVFYITYNDYQQVRLSGKTDVATSTGVITISATSTLGQKEIIKSGSDSTAKKDLSTKIEFPSLDRPYVISSLIDEGMRAKAEKGFSDNIAALKSDPEQFGKWLELALLRKFVEDYRGAEEIWIFTSKKWPDSFISYNNLADLYTFYLKDYPKAEANLKKVTELDIKNISAYRNLYMLYYNQYTEKKSEALPILLSGIKFNPASTELMALAASVYKDEGNKSKAEEYYNMALSIARARNNTSLASYLEEQIKGL